MTAAHDGLQVRLRAGTACCGDALACSEVGRMVRAGLLVHEWGRHEQ